MSEWKHCYRDAPKKSGEYEVKVTGINGVVYIGHDYYFDPLGIGCGKWMKHPYPEFSMRIPFPLDGKKRMIQGKKPWEYWREIR